MRRFIIAPLLLFVAASSPLAPAASASSADVLHWRPIGPFRGGRTTAVSGVPGRPHEFYIGAVNGGVFKTVNAGRTWTPLFDDQPSASIGAIAVAPSAPDTLYVGSGEGRQRPDLAVGDGIYKSVDGGMTWTHLEGGLPTQAQGVGRIAVAIAPSDGRRIYAFADTPSGGGLYRSDDAGASWTRANGSERVGERGDDLATVAVDPTDAQTVYVTNTSTYRSTDGGRAFVALRGAPGGDDYQAIWIAPDDRKTIVLGSDQGAIISLDGGTSWSSWYNQPTAQFYHVITDDRFPYRVYGGQQESGSAGVLSRGNDGAIGVREWHPVGVEEYGYVAPDPLHPGTIYGGKVSRYDERSGQTREVGPVIGWRSGVYRFRRTAPLAFSPADKRSLYLAGDVLFRTRDYGLHWSIVSPDLSRPNPAIPANVGTFATLAGATPHRGVIYALGLSPRDPRVIWAGTDDGLVWRSADGGAHWRDVTPPGIGPWAKISIVDASPFDAQSAYVAVNRFRLDEQRPQLFRTHDRGRTWTEIDRGIEAAPTNVVRADPARRGLLYAGTERGVWVSYDDGTSWSSLRLNLPAISVRDLAVHGDDLVIGTHGRGFWILDDITSLRQHEELASSVPALLDPTPVWRVMRDTNTDTPLPPDEPAAPNPPDGAILDYVLPHPASHVVLTIADRHGNVVRRFASDEGPAPVDLGALAVPAWWIAAPVRPDTSAGAHRFVWDLHLAAPRAFDPGPTIAAVPHGTPLEPEAPRVPPGTYTVTLDADGARATRNLIVREDPRVAVTQADLERQYAFACRVASSADSAYDASLHARSHDPALARELARANARFGTILSTVDAADAAPTEAQRAAFASQRRALDALLVRAARVDSGTKRMGRARSGSEATLHGR
jgi:photosystem II stability/assembly factor-like uncharacterized protein